MLSHYGFFSPSYESSITNKTDSKVKTVVDNWYKQNIYDKNLENYIVNQVFCNDRSVSDKISWALGDGYTFYKSTLYNTTYRISASYNPSLICLNNNDKFTLNNNSLSNIKGSLNYGNNKLDYPVGMISADEVMLAGGKINSLNSKYYLNNETYVWTSSPSFSLSSNITSYMLTIYPSGLIGNMQPSLNLGVRPVINLKSNVTIIEGAGTELDPYIIK